MNLHPMIIGTNSSSKSQTRTCLNRISTSVEFTVSIGESMRWVQDEFVRGNGALKSRFEQPLTKRNRGQR
ncbi:MAG: hypothetical protein CBB71_19910 [Rhodopirellula sp. TMED11]|nr:MAG: hypothetical protein CBB71_19910 [Rhodopirellula sp. TMED11]